MKKDNDSNRVIVSVCVVTYNSSKYIIETLESIKAQTYSEIELIISDDCSTDDTTNICRLWVRQNNDRFLRCIITETTTNSGVATNLNNAISNCTGTWIKTLAGDDLLAPSCISDNLEYVFSHHNIDALFSSVQNFIVVDEKKQFLPKEIDENVMSFFSKDATEQYKVLLKTNFLPAASFFCKAELAFDNPYDEKYRYLEDYPMWIRLTKQGIRLHYMDAVTVFYRRGETLCSSEERFFSRRHFSSLCLFFWNELIYYIREENDSVAYNAHMQYMYCLQFCDAFLNNKKTFYNRIVYKFIRNIICRFTFFKLD